MMVNGKLYPLHKAISEKWMIHYQTADMAESLAHRQEDLEFLEDMPRVLGPRAMMALGRVCDTLGLDYAGVDFSLGRNGEVLLFEANATMVAPPPSKGEKWDYRRPHVERIRSAALAMLTARVESRGSKNDPSESIQASLA
jgi:hypothetical protein